ncbi:hypothetical protein D3C81_1962430 [compost metagenome]
MKSFWLRVWNYILEISNVAWFLILTSVGYLVLVYVLGNYMKIDDAIMLAQIAYVLVLGIGLAIVHVIRRNEKLHGYHKNKDSYFKILVRFISRLRRR